MATSTDRDSKSAPDWGAPPPPAATHGRAPIYLAAVVAATGGAVLVAGRVWPVLLGLVAIGLGAWAASGEGARVLRGLGAVRVGSQDPEHARLMRLVSGISGDLGIEPPAVFASTAPGNAFVGMARFGPYVAVSSDLERDLALTELEAVVAHCLCRLRADLGVARWARMVPGWTRSVGPCGAAAHDLAAVALTRYPPGLARAIEKARPYGGASRGLALVPAAGDDCSPEARVARLDDV